MISKLLINLTHITVQRTSSNHNIHAGAYCLFRKRTKQLDLTIVQYVGLSGYPTPTWCMISVHRTVRDPLTGIPMGNMLSSPSLPADTPYLQCRHLNITKASKIPVRISLLLSSHPTCMWLYPSPCYLTKKAPHTCSPHLVVP